MINLAVFHGFNGLRQVLDEYVTRAGRRVFAHTLIWSAMTGLMVIGTYAILMFQQDKEYIQRWKAERERRVVAAAALAPGTGTAAAPR
jgi:succinate dehydrogenase / fumarate reductase membrane anchor subunit